MDYTFTLGDIWADSPCKDFWVNLLTALGQSHANPNMKLRIGLGDVMLANGRADAMWCLDLISPRQRMAIAMFAVKRVSAHTTDARVKDGIAAVDRWLAGDDSVDLKATAEMALAAKAAARLAADRAAMLAADAVWAAAKAMAQWAWQAAEFAVDAGARENEIALQRADIMRLSPALHLKEGAL